MLEGGKAEMPPQARVVSMEAFGKKLAHQFPWDPAAMVSIGLAMRRRFLSDPLAPSTRSRRQQIMRVRLDIGDMIAQVIVTITIHQRLHEQ